MNVVPRRLSVLDSLIDVLSGNDSRKLRSVKRWLLPFTTSLVLLSQSVLHFVGDGTDNGFRLELVPLNKLPLCGGRIARSDGLPTWLMRYRAEATSITGFVQQIACCYLRHGYWFYVTGHIPRDKDPRVIDTKLIEKYGIDVSESTRARRKRSGRANLQFLRHDRFFVILATKGEHDFFRDEASRLRDIRHTPLKYGGYSISYRIGGRGRDGQRDHRRHAHVAIERQRYLELKAAFLNLATHRRAETLALAFYEIPFEPYAPIRRQLLNILRAVNHARRKAGFRPLPSAIIPMRRRVVKPFGEFKANCAIEPRRANDS